VLNPSVTLRDQLTTNEPMARELKVSDDGEAAFQSWAIVERFGIQIGGLPMKARETAFADAELCLRTAGNQQGLSGQRLDLLVGLQMRAIRQIVTEHDVRKGQRTNRNGKRRLSDHSAAV
jgi:hypothetical protein